MVGSHPSGVYVPSRISFSFWLMAPLAHIDMMLWFGDGKANPQSIKHPQDSTSILWTKGFAPSHYIQGIDSSRAPWSSSFLPWALATLSCLAACGSGCCNSGTLKIWIWRKENPLHVYILYIFNIYIYIYICGCSTHFQHKWKFSRSVDLKQLEEGTSFN